MTRPQRSGSTGFNTGVWVTANEVTNVTNWVSGGRALGTKSFAIDTGSSSLCFSSPPTPRCRERDYRGCVRVPGPQRDDNRWHGS